MLLFLASRKLGSLPATQCPILFCRRAFEEITLDRSVSQFWLTFFAGAEREVLNPTTSGDLSLMVVPVEVFPVNEGMPSSSTGSEAVCTQIKHWIDSCVLHHEGCGRDSDPTWKPTRLLDLGEIDTIGDPRLVESKDHFASKQDRGSSCVDMRTQGYTTLSHCWGSIEIFKLKRDNINSLYGSIPRDQLPKTFREAIDMIKRLGVRYLWIDSLCIIQDSTEDWRREAAVMHHVYKNAWCNISATGAKDGSVGCFFPRNPNTFNATVVRPNWEEAQGKTFAIVQPTDILRERMTKSPLLKRAWVLQERLLAPRVVHFAQEQVFFECHKYLACELYPQGIPDPHGDECLKCLRRNHRDRSWIHRTISADEEDYKGVPSAEIEWNRIVESYTGSSLTMPRDKLITLSGIATEFQRTRLPGVQYLAGLWRSHMPDALCWQPDEAASRPAEYRAPSWSWGRVGWPHLHGKHRATWRILSRRAHRGLGSRHDRG